MSLSLDVQGFKYKTKNEVLRQMFRKKMRHHLKYVRWDAFIRSCDGEIPSRLDVWVTY